MSEAAEAPAWEERTLYSLGDYQNGRAFKPSETGAATGLPVIKIAELNGGISDLTGCCAGGVSERHLIQEGDLLFAWSGSVGVYRYPGPVAALNQHIFKCTAGPGVDQEFFRFVLEGHLPVFRGIVEDKRTTMGHVQVADLKRLTTTIPPLPTQRAIASVLTAIDDKIANNELLMEELTSLMDAECQAAADARADVKTMSLVEAVRLVNGGAYTKGADGNGRMVVRIKELNSGPSETTVYNDITVPDDKTVRPGDVLFAWSGSLGVWRWYRDEAIVNQHIFKVLPKEHPLWLGTFHIREALTSFQDIAAGKATTMGHITKDHLQRAQVPVFSHEELAAMTDRVEPLWAHQLVLGTETLSLRSLREFLLPRLLSGELRVAEEQLAGASS